jgi:hypothetical protein
MWGYQRSPNNQFQAASHQSGFIAVQQQSVFPIRESSYRNRKRSSIRIPKSSPQFSEAKAPKSQVPTISSKQQVIKVDSLQSSSRAFFLFENRVIVIESGRVSVFQNRAPNSRKPRHQSHKSQQSVPSSKSSKWIHCSPAAERFSYSRIELS